MPALDVVVGSDAASIHGNWRERPGSTGYPCITDVFNMNGSVITEIVTILILKF